MRYIKILIVLILSIILLIYSQLNKDNNSVFEDQLSIFIFIESNQNIRDILFDLEQQIKSFDDYIYNVYYNRGNDFLVQNKLKLLYDCDYFDYRQLFNSRNLSDFNINVANLIEEYFLENDISIYRKRKYALRDFLTRFYRYIDFQANLFKQSDANFNSSFGLEDFLIGQQYFSDYSQNYYIARIQFLDLNSIEKYNSSGMDSVLTSILDYTSKVFGTNIELYDPRNNDNAYILNNEDFDLHFEPVQYVMNFNSLDSAISAHQDLLLSDNVVFIESIYDYYFNLDNKDCSYYKLKTDVMESVFYVDYSSYIESLLFLEEKLIELQVSDLYNDKVIKDILFELVGDGNSKGFYSEYIDSINMDSDHIFNNMNKLFTYELRNLLEKVERSGQDFNIDIVPLNARLHLNRNNQFQVKYFIK